MKFQKKDKKKPYFIIFSFNLDKKLGLLSFSIILNL